MKTKSLNKLIKELERLQKKLNRYEIAKDNCVDQQNDLCDLNQDYGSKYEKLIKTDFELAEKINEHKKLVKNKKLQVKRSQNKVIESVKKQFTMSVN